MRFPRGGSGRGGSGRGGSGRGGAGRPPAGCGGEAGGAGGRSAAAGVGVTGVSGPPRTRAGLRDPSAQLGERGGRETGDHGQGRHGAGARPAGTGDGRFEWHRRGRGPSTSPRGTEGGGLCPHRGEHRGAGCPGTLIPCRCDLSNEEDILSMFSAICSQHSGVDICINNAGLARPDTLLSGSTSGWKDMLNVNVLALSICTREAYQSMKEWKLDDGQIININSMSGHRVAPHPVVHFYSASKYAVTALTEGLRQELREAQTHIRATCISPGMVEMGFSFKLLDKEPERAAAIYEKIKCLKPEDVAEAVINVLSTSPHVQIGDTHMRPTEQVT